MKTITRALAVAAAFLATPALAQAPSGDPARGEAAYRKNLCYTCHGSAGQGGDRGSGPRLSPGLFAWEACAQPVRRPRAVMPRYPAQFVSEQDLADMHAFLAQHDKPGRKASDIPLLATDATSPAAGSGSR